MNILFITNTLPPVVDGVGDYTLNLAKEFVAHGHNVSIVCKHDDLERAEDEGFHIFPIVKKWDKQNAEPVIQLIDKEHIDVVSLQYVPHGFEPHGLPFSLIGFIKKIRGTGTPIFTFCHEVYWKYRGTNIKYLAESLLMALISKEILKVSTLVATSISHYAEMIVGLCRKNASLIPIASNIPITDPDEDTARRLRSEIAPHNEFIVAFIGKREMATVSMALQRLIQGGYPIKILLIGKTNEIIGIKNQYCYHTGILDIDELSKYVSVADCMIMPQDNKSGCSFKSGSLAAALGFGLPVVTSRGIMTDDSLKDKENILFVDSSSADSYYDAILSLMRDKTLAKKVAQGSKTIGMKLTWEETYRKYMDIINK